MRLLLNFRYSLHLDLDPAIRGQADDQLMLGFAGAAVAGDRGPFATPLHVDLARWQAFADEISGLRQRIADLEGESKKHEDRATRQQARLKAVLQDEERVREVLEQALSQLKHDGVDGDEDIDIDELAEA